MELHTRTRLYRKNVLVGHLHKGLFLLCFEDTMNNNMYGLGVDTSDDNSKDHRLEPTKTFHDNTYMTVPLVGLVDSATPYEAKIKHESIANNSHLRVEDNLSKIFEVHKRPALVTDSVSEKNDNSQVGQHW